MDGVYNRKLFAKKATDARDKLREMGGVQPMPRPQVSGIMASSPELMQAAMRKQVVLPASDRPMPMAPMPQPMAPMLPPSQPIPNIAGIPQTQPQQPRPQQQQQPQQPVKRMNEGGFIKREATEVPDYVKGAIELGSAIGRETPLTLGFKKSLEFAQKALTGEDAASLGLPEGANVGPVKKALENPEQAAKEIVGDVVPENQRTGDTKKDLLTAAKQVGVTEIPVEAEIDELNRAIFGAKLAGAIAGSYVNPSTGQELRPTAGARIASAAVEGLAVARDTETRRAKQEADLAKAQIAAAARTKAPKTFFETEQGEAALKLYLKRIENNEDPAEVEALMNEQLGNNIGTRVRQAIAGSTPAPQTTGGLAVGTTATNTSTGEKIRWDGSSWQTM